MKTQKELPELFYIQENEKTNEYCERLGISRDDLTTEKDYGDYLVFKNGEFIDSYYGDKFNRLKNNYPNAVFVDLADYIDQEQPELSGTTIASNTDTGDTFEIKTDGNRMPIEPKWQDKTRGGYEYHIYEEFEGRIYGRVKTDVGNWLPIHWYDKGNYSSIENHNWDLLPYNPLLTTLEKELEEVRLKEKQILEKIEELKTK